MHFTRADEPPEIIHEYTYTIEMATAQGLTRNRNWQQMPLQMLRSRVLTMGLRATYPDAVSGIYSADEIADHTDMSDDERAAISAESLGEELKAPTSRAPRRQASRPPQPAAAPSQPKIDPPKPKIDPPKPKADPLYKFDSEESFWEIVEEHSISVEAVNSVAKRQGEEVASMSPDELEAFFYKFVIHRSVRSSWSWIERWWEDDREDFIEAIHTSTIAEYPVLEDAPPSFYGPRLHEPAFVETVRQACSMEDKHQHECQRTIRYMEADDWSAYYKLVELAKT